ncbi:MAG: TraR/DksA C4-type zinc finger protein [Proteobacteria bacterium]|nr:TraR/DksA C4-type zinc finger protein [Pseudomonadota bacterium]
MVLKNPEKILVARRDELLDIMKASTEDSQPVELDQSRVGRLSRIDALQGQAMAQETERRRRNELQRIDAALERVKSGDFGYCVNCDEQISDKRLKLDPSTPLCIDCATVK